MEKENELEIDLLGLFYYLKKKVWMIAVVFAACAVLGFVGTKLFITPTYTATTRIYVMNQGEDRKVAYSDFQIAAQFVNDYKVLITGRNVTKEVIEVLNLDMTPAALQKKISVAAETNTRVLDIGVKDSDPQRAADIANCVREIASVQLQEIMSVDAVNLVYSADVPQRPSSPGAMYNAVLAAALGLIAVVGILAVRFMLDDSIRTEEDVEQYLGLGTLGVIPDSAELSTAPAPRPAAKGSARAKK